MKTKKLNLQELNVNSFVTNLDSQNSKTIKGADGVTQDHLCLEVSVHVSLHVSAHVTEQSSATTTKATSGAVSAITSLVSFLEAGPDIYRIANAVANQSIDGVIGMACTRMINAGACDVAI